MNKSLLLALPTFFVLASCSNMDDACEDITLASEQIQECQALHKRIVDAKGDKVIYKGLALNDPAVLTAEKEWNEAHFDHIQKWDANVVRIPITPSNWQKHGKEFYFEAIDEAAVVRHVLAAAELLHVVRHEQTAHSLHLFVSLVVRSVHRNLLEVVRDDL